MYATTPDYLHALEVDEPQRLLFVSGTMGLDANGQAPPTLEAQLELVWANIAEILASAGMTLNNIVRVTSYLRDAADAPTNAAARMRALGRAVPTTAIVVGHLDDSWLVEIEVIAAG